MHSSLQSLNIDPRLACEFLGVFARCEFALKVGGFPRGNSDRVDPDWDLFGRTIAPQFNTAHDPALTKAVAYLLDHPPKKQVLIGDHIEWRDVPRDTTLPVAEQVLIAVRRVRNNLFHGGKFLAADEPGSSRDRLLVEHSIAVLRACILLHTRVSAVFES